jgi:hypothetical protein
MVVARIGRQRFVTTSLPQSLLYRSLHRTIAMSITSLTL